MSWLAGSYSLCSALWHSTVQNGNFRTESTTISDADTSGNKIIPFSWVVQRKDKESGINTHIHIYGWKGERGSKRLVIACYYSIQLFMFWSQSYTNENKKNNRKRGSKRLWIAANAGELSLALPLAWLVTRRKISGLCDSECLTWGALMKLCYQVLFTLWTSGFSKGLQIRLSKLVKS